MCILAPILTRSILFLNTILGFPCRLQEYTQLFPCLVTNSCFPFFKIHIFIMCKTRKYYAKKQLSKFLVKFLILMRRIKEIKNRLVNKLSGLKSLRFVKDYSATTTIVTCEATSA
ncbi:Uncharacterised protein [Phocoenobacter uteri]|uniref:Uncharacterized protein n=1 Tax=Phocoenobacter uteri TaxID=146806 RepID=A0A379C7G9_9PAST|nr:Uncharacterised protein [Phocoenobacter uteri]